jgi:hypothetical protein
MFRDEWWRGLFACIDGKQTSDFLSYLHPDALFRYGSSPAVVGLVAIGHAVDLFFDSIRSSSHKVIRTWLVPDCAICQGEVSYVLPDGGEVTLPFCNILSLTEGQISRYEIYIDPTPLMPAKS